MGGDWRKVTIQSLIDEKIITGHKDGNYGSLYPRSSEFGTEGVPFLTAKSLNDGCIDIENAPRLDIKKASKLKFGFVETDDVLLSHNATVGRVAVVPELKERILIGTSLTYYRLDQKRLLPRYLAAYFTGHDFQNELAAAMSQTTRNQVPITGQRRLPVVLPPIPEQKAIAHILGSLDDKIELNRRMNTTLAGMAQALFKSWFVDFDPVIDNAIKAGNPIPEELAERTEIRRQALAESTANREAAKQFPAAFQLTEELGWIPEGWEARPFGGLLENTIGGDWGKEKEEGKHTFPSVIIRGTDMPQIAAGYRSSAPKRWVEPKKFATRELQDSDIVIEISGGSPTQSTGRSLYITENIISRLGGSVEPASFCRKFRPLNRTYGLYGGLHLASIYEEGKMWEYQNQSTGISNFQTTSFLEREFVAIPIDSKVLDTFYEIVRPFFDKITGNQQVQLANLRDTLLPKLISGELRIPEAENLVEIAV